MMSTIVLIEDNHNNAKLVTKILEAYGHTVHHACNALSGLHAVQEIRPDLVLLDFGLPDLDGKVVANRLCHLTFTRDIPIIAFTADTTTLTRRLAISYGCRDVITKPIDTRAFPEQIASHLNLATV